MKTLNRTFVFLPQKTILSKLVSGETKLTGFPRNSHKLICFVHTCTLKKTLVHLHAMRRWSAFAGKSTVLPSDVNHFAMLPTLRILSWLKQATSLLSGQADFKVYFS